MRLKERIITLLRGIFRPILIPLLSEPIIKEGKDYGYFLSRIQLTNVVKRNNVIIRVPYSLIDVSIGDNTYISAGSQISLTEIGKFCSLGPNLFCGWGIHPTNGLSTSPTFYSARMQAGKTFARSNKIDERKRIIIGNDVFIGANVTVIDGVSIGDGAVIGAGAVVSKDIPPYAIAVGCPIQIIKYRFGDKTISKLLQIKWWDFGKRNVTNKL